MKRFLPILVAIFIVLSMDGMGEQTGICWLALLPQDIQNEIVSYLIYANTKCETPELFKQRVAKMPAAHTETIEGENEVIFFKNENDSLLVRYKEEFITEADEQLPMESPTNSYFIRIEDSSFFNKTFSFFSSWLSKNSLASSKNKVSCFALSPNKKLLVAVIDHAWIKVYNAAKKENEESLRTFSLSDYNQHEGFVPTPQNEVEELEYQMRGYEPEAIDGPTFIEPTLTKYANINPIRAIAVSNNTDIFFANDCAVFSVEKNDAGVLFHKKLHEDPKVLLNIQINDTNFALMPNALKHGNIVGLFTNNQTTKLAIVYHKLYHDFKQIEHAIPLEDIDDFINKLAIKRFLATRHPEIMNNEDENDLKKIKNFNLYKNKLIKSLPFACSNHVQQEFRGDELSMISDFNEVRLINLKEKAWTLEKYLQLKGICKTLTRQKN